MSSEPGTIGWMDLTVGAAVKVRDFYTQVVGWEHEPLDMGGYSDYSMGPPGRNAVAGVCHARGVNAGLPPCWLIYINVADMDASVAAARRLGGKVLLSPRTMQGMGRFCVLEDPAGAAVALFEATRDENAEE